MRKSRKVFLAGHNGLVGKAIFSLLKSRGIKTLTIPRQKLDLTNQKKVLKYLKLNKPDGIIIAAARVGGINANNKYRAEFIYQNLMIQNNIIHSSYLSGVKNLIFLGSSCVYPKNCKQPISEKELLSGYLEYTNEPYAIAKIAGIKMCENYSNQYNINYKSLMPCNSFGKNDNYNLSTSHFLPALVRKVAEAKKNKSNTIELWGDGKALREVIHSEEIAKACLFFLFKKTKYKTINVGSGYEKTIRQYLDILFKAANYKCKISYKFKSLKGTPRKILNNSLAKRYGWISKKDTKQKIIQTYKMYEKTLYN